MQTIYYIIHLMGNKMDSNYDMVDMNSEFDPIKPKPTNKISNLQNTQLQSTSIVLENIISESKAICSKLYKIHNYNEIEQLFAKYSHDTIMHFYMEHAIEFFKKNDDKAQLIAKLLPENKKYQLAAKYINAKININLITIMANNLNMGHVDKNNKTVLFKILFNAIDVDYLCDIISFCNVNINHVYRYDTFLTSLIHNTTITTENIQKYMKLITLLTTKNYNFNFTNVCGYTLLTELVIDKSDLCFYYSELIKIKNYDITKECLWLHLMINKHWNKIHNYLYQMLCREDHERLLYDIYINYHYPTYEDDFIRILTKLNNMNTNKTINMLNYINSKNGNTLLHEISIRRGKKLLNFITYYFNGKVLIKQNNENKYPYELYLINNLENRLK